MLTATLTHCAPAACVNDVRHWSKFRATRQVHIQRWHSQVASGSVAFSPLTGLTSDRPFPPPRTRPVFQSPLLYSRQAPGPGGGRSGEAAQPVRALFLACHPIPIPRCYDFFFPIFFCCGGLPLGPPLRAAAAAVASHPSVARNVSCRTIDGVSQPTFVGVVRRRYLTDRSAPAAWDMGALGWASFHVRRLTGLGTAMPPL